VSLIYGILDLTTGRLILARAGHCPMLYVGDGGASYVRPDGMGLGLGHEPVFSDAIEEQTIDLHPGDLCLFYTDGITRHTSTVKSSATNVCLKRPEKRGEFGERREERSAACR